MNPLHIPKFSRKPRQSRSPSDASSSIVAFTPSDLATRLAAALPEGIRLQLICRQVDLPPAVIRGCAALVFDPMSCDDPAGLNAIIESQADRTPLIVYTRLTADAVHRIVAMPATRRAFLILKGVDDGPGALRELLAQTIDHARCYALIGELGAIAGVLPQNLRRALEQLVVADAPVTVAALARAANMSVRTLERRLASAGSRPAAYVARATRAAMARSLLQTTSLPIETISRKIGYAKPASLRSLLRWAFNATPNALRRGDQLEMPLVSSKARQANSHVAPSAGVVDKLGYTTGGKRATRSVAS